MVVWITGLSGVGKTTVSRALIKQLRDAGYQPVHLDGDEIRDVVRDPATGHDRTSRLANAYRICRLAKLLARQGFVVVVSTMSLFHEIHRWNRQELPNYCEVMLTASHGTLINRDPKSIYQRASVGLEQDVGGIDLEVEFPTNADHTFENNDKRDPVGLAGDILTALAHCGFATTQGDWRAPDSTLARVEE